MASNACSSTYISKISMVQQSKLISSMQTRRAQRKLCKIPRREQTSNPLRKPSICEGMDQSLRMTAEDVMLEGLGASSSVGV